MADMGLVPCCLGVRSERYGTPHVTIAMSAVGVLALCWMTFDTAMAVLNLLYCVGQASSSTSSFHPLVPHLASIVLYALYCIYLVK